MQNHAQFLLVSCDKLDWECYNYLSLVKMKHSCWFQSPERNIDACIWLISCIMHNKIGLYKLYERDGWVVEGNKTVIRNPNLSSCPRIPGRRGRWTRDGLCSSVSNIMPPRCFCISLLASAKQSKHNKTKPCINVFSKDYKTKLTFMSFIGLEKFHRVLQLFYVQSWYGNHSRLTANKDTACFK